MDIKKEINYKTMPVPSGPGAQQITVDGLCSEKGGQKFVSAMPKNHVIPDGSKNEKEETRNPSGAKSMGKTSY